MILSLNFNDKPLKLKIVFI